jgi:hypothetical protein
MQVSAEIDPHHWGVSYHDFRGVLSRMPDFIRYERWKVLLQAATVSCGVALDALYVHTKPSAVQMARYGSYPTSHFPEAQSKSQTCFVRLFSPLIDIQGSLR